MLNQPKRIPTTTKTKDVVKVSNLRRRALDMQLKRELKEINDALSYRG